MPPEITGGLFAIVAALIGMLSVIYISRRNARREAGRKLIEVFNSMKASVDKEMWSDGNKLHYFLKESFPELKSQVDNYRTYLHHNRVAGFDKAWISYYNADGDDRCECYNHYIAFGSNNNNKKIFEKNVHAILSFADPK